MLKCIVWDLDNTIWDGVLLEDQHVTLKEKSIELLKKAHSKGIIQTISSKNEYEMAMRQLSDFGIESFFIYPLISFNSKSDNIKTFISDMHFRAEDVLFIDDSNFELNEVKYMIPDIKVKNISDVEEIRKVIDNVKVINTDEAFRRIQFYKNEEKRILDKNNFSDISEFLMQSDFMIHLSKAVSSDLVRIGELLERSHQLNTTGISYSEIDILEMLDSEVWEVIIGEVKDKYGEYGKSILCIAQKENDNYSVKVMIASCRLLGKGITNYVLYYMFERAKVKGCSRLCVDYVKNKHNRSMQILLQMNGFKTELSPEGKYRFWLDIKKDQGTIKKPVWIKEI